MKKKLFLIALLLLQLCLFVGCGMKGRDIEPEPSNYANKYIELINIYEETDGFRGIVTRVAYDKNTKVLYLMTKGNNDSGITPIYNADGTLKLYEE